MTLNALPFLENLRKIIANYVCGYYGYYIKLEKVSLGGQLLEKNYHVTEMCTHKASVHCTRLRLQYYTQSRPTEKLNFYICWLLNHVFEFFHQSPYM